MRIILGKWKGRKIDAKLPSGIRPTQDAVRETIFNILSNYIDFDESQCADICAGAGMLGIEALSRGAEKVYFVDKNYKATEYIKNSLKLIEADPNQYKICKLDAIQFINHYADDTAPPKLLDVVFADPPYNTSIANDILLITSEKPILRKDGILVLETAIFTQLSKLESYELLRERQFGASKISIFRKT